VYCAPLAIGLKQALGKIEAKRKLFCFLAGKRNSQNLKQKENEMKRDEEKQVKQKQHKAKSKK
jgi:hypothetical protein